jgi:hypothetical protein
LMRLFLHDRTRFSVVTLAADRITLLATKA